MRCLGGRRQPKLEREPSKCLASETNQLRIDYIDVQSLLQADGVIELGKLGMCMLPGRVKGKHRRSLSQDFKAINTGASLRASLASSVV
jgi:hypothetical protein